MSVTEGVLQFVREWLLATASSSGALTDEQVIVKDDKAPRPALPYIVCNVLVADIQIGGDEARLADGGADVVDYHMTGHRQGTVTVEGFGTGALAWMERAHRQLTNPIVLRDVLHDIATGQGISLVRLGGITDVAQFIDTQIEPRYLMEYVAGYDVSDSDDTTELVEADTIVHEQTYETDDPAGDFTSTITA